MGAIALSLKESKREKFCRAIKQVGLKSLKKVTTVINATSQHLAIRWDDYNEDWLELTMNVKRLKKKEAHHAFVGTWHICEMEMWDEDYFNMETQAYVNIQADNLGDFQFGLVTGYLDGYLEQENSQERFAFTWEGQDEMDEVSGCGWIKLSDKNEVEGVISLHGRDRSRFKAKRARNVGYSG